MGNCFTSTNKTLSPNAEYEQQSRSSDMIEMTRKHVDAANKKMVRSRLGVEENVGKGDRDHESTKSGVVRIRVLVTKEELTQILNHRMDFNCSTSIEQLVSAMRLREKRRIDHDGSLGIDGSSWKPALASIPEDQ